ncbi:ABC transporter permease [Pullulanibacillus camelliae]|uniref:ABC transporter permease n=1 Tax=Pullulanibacillus camelliae TaxID=1707096 RepID=A0A8J2VXN0_9BACL|nr:energy-coupling factor transporter transmembrane component T [Pullulanibacillus camelliae]GGE40768.1 ABC transporter permease [Pullulanibacillus camelliae]
MKRGFSSFHPLVCFFYYIGTMSVLMLAKQPLFLLTAMLILLVLNGVQDSGRGLRQWWLGLVLIFAGCLFIYPFANHRGTHILFYFHGNPIMLESIFQGGITALAWTSLLLLFLSYNVIITPEKFLFLFAGVLPRWALLTMITLRFVPLLRRRIVEIESVQASKGTSARRGSLYHRAKAGLLIVQILLTWSLEEAVQTADSMKARGYGLGRRSRYIPYTFKKKDSVFLMISLLLLALSLYGCWLGDLVMAVQPILETPLLHGREWLFYVFALGLVGLPLGIEGREVLLWHFYKPEK